MPAIPISDRTAILPSVDTAVAMRGYGSKADRVFEALRSEFVRGDWSFGKTFTTYELAERFGVSRRPVMDAVQRLQTAGFVEVIPQVGCRVAEPDERRLKDHLEVSVILEVPAAGLAAERATPGDVARLEAIHARTTPIVEGRAGAAYPPLNREFHHLILEIAGNERLAVLAESAWDLREFFFHPYLHPGVLDVLPHRHEEHSRIIDAIRLNDRSRAEDAMRKHLDPASALQIVRDSREAVASTP